MKEQACGVQGQAGESEPVAMPSSGQSQLESEKIIYMLKMKFACGYPEVEEKVALWLTETL